ncbi:hypothetical protein HK104_004372 [Borealophlyctis nickersoniae]|nr:hypothetical protein HK104_004372 [Borealophlyctis nickersoniae]
MVRPRKRKRNAASAAGAKRQCLEDGEILEDAPVVRLQMEDGLEEGEIRVQMEDNLEEGELRELPQPTQTEQHKPPLKSPPKSPPKSTDADVRDMEIDYDERYVEIDAKIDIDCKWKNYTYLMPPRYLNHTGVRVPAVSAREFYMLDKVMMQIFSLLSWEEVLPLATVCKKWTDLVRMRVFYNIKLEDPKFIDWVLHSLTKNKEGDQMLPYYFRRLHLVPKVPGKHKNRDPRPRCFRFGDTAADRVRKEARKSIRIKFRQDILNILTYTKHIWELDLGLNNNLCKKIFRDSEFSDRIIPAIKSVRKLNLFNCQTALTDNKFAWALEHCPNIEELNLKDCFMLTDASLLKIVAQCPNLSKLDMCCSSFIHKSQARFSSDGFCKFIRDMTRLREFAFAPRFKVENNDPLQAILELPNLKKLTLSNLDVFDISSDGLKMLKVECASLTHLKIRESPDRTAILHAFVKSCPNLRVVELENCLEVAREDIQVLKEAKRLESLSFVYMPGTDVTRASIADLLSELPRLKSFRLLNCPRKHESPISPFLLDVIAYQENLQHITLSYKKDETPAFYKALLIGKDGKKRKPPRLLTIVGIPSMKLKARFRAISDEDKWPIDLAWAPKMNLYTKHALPLAY